jgi:hypothetical protein
MLNKKELLESAINRFNKYSEDRSNGHWLWSGATVIPRSRYSNNKIPVITFDKRTVYARRFAYENIANKKIEKGMSLVAGCGNKLCVNPDCAVQIKTSEIHLIRYDKDFLKNKLDKKT